MIPPRVSSSPSDVEAIRGPERRRGHEAELEGFRHQWLVTVLGRRITNEATPYVLCEPPVIHKVQCDHRLIASVLQSTIADTKEDMTCL
jgi:hypothetical protein